MQEMTVDEAQQKRIAARRLLVLQRMKEGGDDGNAAMAIEGEGDGKGPVKSAANDAARARRDLGDLLSCAHSAVTNWRVSAGVNEAEHREREDRLVEERRKKRLEEIETCAVKRGAIELNFESIYRLNVPYELQQSLEEQQRQCEELIGVKDRLIETLRGQLEEREEEFVALLKRNANDVNGLVAEMRDQTERYLDAYTVKLRHVENSYEEERREFLTSCNNEINQLLKLRRTRETEYRSKRETKIFEAQTRMDAKHREGCEEYNELKREHMQEIHALMEELERCKAEFLLNGERLSYNLQVLRERVKENKSVQALQKRKLARLQDILSTLVARYADSEKKYQRINKDLTAQLHRVADQYCDLQKKFQKFEKSDKEKYRQLWRMHEEKNIQLAHRCLRADRLLFEEILGVPWNPPQLNYWPADDAADAAEETDAEDVSSDDEIELSEDALMLLALLHKQAAFIAEENVYNAIKQVQGVSEERAVVESILATLQIRKNKDMEDMLEYFMVDAGDDATALIRPEEAVRALSTFLTERQRKRKQEEEGQKQSSKKKKELARVKLEERRRVAEREYWTKMAESVPKDHLRVWGALETGLQRYIAQLQQRKELIEATDSLRTQNHELRDLLAHYLESDVNYQLHMPPQLVLQSRAAV